MGLVLLYIYAYLVGSIPTAYIIGKLVRGIDIRKYGSGNVGGANVFSNVGKVWVVPLGLFELFVKGASPIWIGMALLDLNNSSPKLVVAPLITIAGNNWSPYLKFTGGRGIAVALGALFALSYKELVLFSGIAFAGWALFRSAGVWVYISLALLPLWSVLLGEPMAITWFCLGLLAIVTMKRLTANWDPLPAGLPRGQVYFNRLFRDRDFTGRDQWLSRIPKEEDRSPG